MPNATGELTSRFVLKALTVIVVCGAIFIYYFGSLRWDRNTDVAHAKTRSLMFGIAAAATVVVSFCIGLGVAGTPSEQRHIEADLKRVQDLQRIANAVNIWHKRAEIQKSSAPLPATLSDLSGKGVTPSQIVDPETKIPYEYHAKSDTNYEVCATFSASEDQARVTQFWYHRKGQTCFTLDASQLPVW